VTDLAPLVLLWVLSRSGFGGGGGSSQAAPDWPTTRSPPPPLPAFVPQVPSPPTPSPEPHGTPLTSLHQKTPKVRKGKAGPTATLKDGALNMAKGAAQHATANARKALQQRLSSLNPFAKPSHGEVLVSKAVMEIQKVVNVRGGTLKKDGLWGPNTAAAWKSLARQQGLPPNIERAGPKVARVSAHAWDVLSVPPII
jgi:hypothetical protein